MIRRLSITLLTLALVGAPAFARQYSGTVQSVDSTTVWIASNNHVYPIPVNGLSIHGADGSMGLSALQPGKEVILNTPARVQPIPFYSNPFFGSSPYDKNFDQWKLKQRYRQHHNYQD